MGKENITVVTTTMEKNLAENSDSSARREDHGNNDNAGHAPSSPMADPTEPEPTPDAEAETEPAPNQGDEESEERELEAAAEIVPPESPPVSLEKASEDIDQFLATVRQSDKNIDDGSKNDGGDEEGEKDEASFEIPVSVDKFLDLVEEKIATYDAGEEKVKEDSSLLEAVKRISNLLKSLQTHRQPESLMNRVGLIQQRAMSYLEEDFRLLMEEYRSPIESDPGGGSHWHDHKGKHVAAEPPPQEDSEQKPAESEPDFPGYSEEAIASLNKIAGEMIAGGYQSECCQVYMLSRRHAFDEILQKLGFEKISIDEIQKVQWEPIMARDMIPAWINTLKQCTAVYFPGELSLAEAVFSDRPSVAAGLFCNLSRGVVIRLLNFAEGAAMTRRASEKLFKVLDMYETLRDVIPKMDGLFPEESVVDELKTEMNLAKQRLGETVISIFCDFENSIKADTAKTPVPGGAVHPLTRYIMNYLNTTGDYKETMEQVFKEHSKIERADSTSRPNHENEEHGGRKESESEASSPFAAQVMRLMDLLDSSLEANARLYRDVALSNFFMMNNGRYILQKIKGSNEMCQVMGDNWCRKRSSELRTYHKNYQRETWNRVLQCLSHEGLSVNGKVQKPVLKERFKSFNALFDDIHRTQSSWMVQDEQLQSELRVSVSAVVIPAYRSFLGRFSQYLDPGRQTEKYIKYQPDDIETYIEELFDGKPHQSITRRRT